ncbi:MAG: A/G-specific adenine glycosylase [Negativicutes bacterium]
MNYVALTQVLLEWYDRMRRDLPWRKESDPYRIWVSEIMLQQTRVEAVIPYYYRFLQRFPDMRALAEAPEDELLAAWQGLGYYSRARNLQQGVREVMTRYEGQTPDTRVELISLPGIGTYTAGAILSIAHNKPEPAVDGNVLRVFSRLMQIEEEIERPQIRQRIEAEVRVIMETIPRYGDITQALMELGALVCVPRNPRCPECPWTEFCIACKNQVQGLLPKKKPSAPPRVIGIVTGILIVDKRVLAVKRPAKGLLAGMWEFPSVEGEEPDPVTEGAQLLYRHFRDMGIEVAVESPWDSLTHVFSHREWRLRIYRCQALRGSVQTTDAVRWMDREQMSQVSWAGPHRKIAARIMDEGFGEQLLEKGM